MGHIISDYISINDCYNIKDVAIKTRPDTSNLTTNSETVTNCTDLYKTRFYYGENSRN